MATTVDFVHAYTAVNNSGLIMIIFTGLCLVDGVSIFVPFFTYITAMILYVLPMSFIGSKEAELVCIELENESGKIKQIEQIITQKMKREIIIDNVTEKSIVKRASMIDG